MDALLELLQQDGRIPIPELAAQLGMSEQEIVTKIREWETDGTILAYQAVINRDSLNSNNVTALIEVKVIPERQGGFDRIASRIARFEEVESVYLMSGGYDLLVMVEGKSLRDVASFVAQKLSTIEAVQSCATRFRLKTYKENRIFYQQEEVLEPLSIAP